MGWTKDEIETIKEETKISSRTLSRKAKVNLLRETIKLSLDILFLPLRNIERVNVHQYRSIVNKLKHIYFEASSEVYVADRYMHDTHISPNDIDNTGKESP